MKVLVLVDCQNDFIDGEFGTPEAKAVVPKIVDKINNYDEVRNTLLLFTKDTHGSNYLDTLEGKMLPIPHCIENTHGWSINREIKDAVKANRFLSYSSNEIKKGRIYKNTFGSDVLGDLLVKHKAEIEEVEFVGVCTDICVISNALMARQTLPNTRIVVDASCCAGSDIFMHDAALTVMESCQIKVTNWDVNLGE